MRKSTESGAPSHALDRSGSDDYFGERRRAWNAQRTQLTWLESTNRRPRGLAS